MKYQQWVWRGLALATACMASNAQAVRFQEIQLGSYLNEPLKARIEINRATADELDSLVPSLASANAFQAAGIERSDTLANLTFTLGPDRQYLYVQSDEAIREPFLLFLLRADWQGGSLTREYAMLLDPPGSDTAVRFPLPDRSTAKVKPFLANPELIAKTPRARPDPTPKPLASEPASAADAASALGQVIVRSGDSLSKIARQYFDPALAPSMDEFMNALFRLNPQAFIDGDLNLIRAGATLNLPGLPASPKATPGGVIAQQPDPVEEIAVVELPASDLTLVTDNGIVEDVEAQFLRQRIQELELQLAQMQANNASRTEVGQLIASQTGAALVPLTAPDHTPPSKTVTLAPVATVPTPVAQAVTVTPTQPTQPWFLDTRGWMLGGGIAVLMLLLAIRRRLRNPPPVDRDTEMDHWDTLDLTAEPSVDAVPTAKPSPQVSTRDLAEQALLMAAYGQATPAISLLENGIERAQDDADHTLVKALARICKSADPDAFDALVDHQVAHHPDRTALIQFLSGIAGQNLAIPEAAQGTENDQDLDESIVLGSEELDMIEFTLDIDEPKN